MQSSYHLISSDSHVNEPPDLWVDRVPAALRDRAPRIEHLDQGDTWVVEGVAGPMPFGLDAEVLYPTPRLMQAVYATTDVELHVALVRAYNDWNAWPPVKAAMTRVPNDERRLMPVGNAARLYGFGEA